MPTERTLAEDLESASGTNPARQYGWLSLLRSVLIFDPLIWSYTIFLGVVSIPVSLAGDKERILHNFARFWSWLIMKTIQSPVTVSGLEKIDTAWAGVGEAVDLDQCETVAKLAEAYQSVYTK